jgi:hypothetical protein
VARAARPSGNSRRNLRGASTAPTTAAAAAFLSATLAGAGAARAVIVFGQFDDFEDGTTMGWSHQFPSPNPPTNVPDGGPQGAGDNYLQNISNGGAGAGSRQVVFNQAQWAGNYVSAGVTRITGFMRNFGTTDLFMRLAVEGGILNTRYASTNAISLPAGGLWTPVTFDLTPSSMTIIAGTEDLPTVLGNVGTLRILSAQSISYMGDIVAATLGVDNLRALRLQGDANFDGNVNLNDFNALASNFGTTGGATWQQGDFNFDGNVNLNDFNLLAAHFGQSISGPSATPGDWSLLGAAVPEPGVAGALLPAAAAVLRRRRRGA